MTTRPASPIVSAICCPLHPPPGDTRASQWIACASLALALFVSYCARTAVAQELASEYRVKAAFLLNFAKFVEWPAESLGKVTDPINVCIFGQDPFQGDLEQVIRNKTVNNRALAAHRISTPSQARTCHIVFISSLEKARSRELLAGLRDASALTVGEDPEFARSGGMITFVIDDDRVRFDINLGPAAAARVRISAKVLSVARTVKVGP